MSKFGRKYPIRLYRKEVNHFKLLQRRVRENYTTSVWPATTEGFYAFLECVGPSPKDMVKPSIGRIDHSKGYEPGNCSWQEYAENGLEALNRETSKQKRLAANKKMWADPVRRADLISKISEGLIGNQNGAKH